MTLVSTHRLVLAAGLGIAAEIFFCPKGTPPMFTSLLSKQLLNHFFVLIFISEEE